MPRPALTLTIAVAVLVIVLFTMFSIPPGALIESVAGPEIRAVEPPRTAVPDEVRETLTAIERALARIEERLAALETRSTNDARTPVLADGAEPVDLASLTADIAELKQALAARERDARSLSELKAEHPDAAWHELQKVIDLWQADEERALQEMRLLSFEDVLRRYGTPTEMWSNEKGTNWIYGEGSDPDGGYRTEVWLRFRDGVVTTLGVKSD